MPKVALAAFWAPLSLIGDKRREIKYRRVGYAMQLKFDYIILVQSLAKSASALCTSEILGARSPCSSWLLSMPHLD
jgi:hypothetical protein